MQVYIMRRPVRLQAEIAQAVLRPDVRDRTQQCLHVQPRVASVGAAGQRREFGDPEPERRSPRSPSAQPYATPALYGIAECLGVIAPDRRQIDARSTGNIPEA